MLIPASLKLMVAASRPIVSSASRSQWARFSTSLLGRQQQPAAGGDSAKVVPAVETKAADGPRPGGATHRPTAMDKKYLVWSGKYKSESEIPEFVAPETMERANNRTRIRIANIMMLLTVVGCIAMIYSGKSAAKGGDSVQQRNLDWHKQYNKGNEEPKK